MRKAALGVAAAVLAIVAAGCAGSGEGTGDVTNTSGGGAAGTVQLGGTLTAARAADANLWDPALIAENDSLWATIQTNGTLIVASEDGKGFEPFIAESWEASDDGKVFTFNLYPDAKFCDGTPITSQDVKFSLERAAGSEGASWMFPEGIEIDASDPQTVVITLENPSASFLSYVTLWGMQILSEAHATEVGDEALSSEPLGSGPFCLGSWERGSEITLTRNEHFWLKDDQGNRLPYLDEIKWRIIKDDGARAVALESGEVDAITAVSPSQVTQLESNPDITLGESPLLGTINILMNQNVPAISDVKVRQALNYATDKQAIIDAVFFGHAQPALSPLYLANYTNEDYGYQHDLEKAKALMAESGHPDGFSAKIDYLGGDATAQQALTILKDQWAEIGVDVELNPIEEGVLFDTWAAGKWDMKYQLSTNDIYDPAENLPWAYGGEVAGADSAWTHYENPELFETIQAAEREFDTERRAALYDEIQETIMTEGPNVSLVHPANLWAARNDVHGFEVYKTGLHPFMYTWKSGS